MSMLILGILILAAVIYSLIFRRQKIIKVLETITVFILVGYCGVFIFVICAYGIYDPIKIADFVRFPAGHPFQMFLTFSLLGMSIISILSIWLRGVYLIAPVVCWSVFWFGATYVHLQDVYLSKGYISLKYFWVIFASHGLVSVLLIGLIGFRYYLGIKLRRYTPKEFFVTDDEYDKAVDDFLAKAIVRFRDARGDQQKLEASIELYLVEGDALDMSPYELRDHFDISSPGLLEKAGFEDEEVEMMAELFEKVSDARYGT